MDTSKVAPPTPDEAEMHAVVPEDLALKRLDVVATLLFPPHSRRRIQQWIAEGRLLADGLRCERDQAARPGQVLALTPGERTQHIDTPAQDLQLHIIHRDEHLFIIDKPAGLVSHPAPGHPEKTLVNGLLHLDDALHKLPRAGLVHRLDRDTTGLLVVARTEAAWQSLSKQLRQRSIKRHYRALVRGVPTAGGTLNKAIGRHPQNRLRMAVRPDGRPSETHFRIHCKFRHHAELDIQLMTGRTHQIRVHLTDAGLPLIGDQTYGNGSDPVRGMDEAVLQAVRQFPRQALHAHSLALQHPYGGRILQWQSEIPQDYRELCSILQHDAESSTDPAD